MLADLTSGDIRHRFLLPFKADACAIATLREAADAQLAAWGLSALTDGVTLAVSELATNVICHVGPGAPAVLFLEVTRDRLRVEVHDTSRTHPTRSVVGGDGETGRGLALVAAVSGGWTAVPTPGGKAVRCDFAVGNAHRLRFGPRVERAARVIDGYRLHSSGVEAPLVAHRAVSDTLAISLFTDLFHWIRANGSDPDDIVDHAQTCFEAEAAEVQEPVLPPVRNPPGPATAHAGR
ncbi:ATP-binding protein [Streptomyces sp. NPDC004031]